MSDADTESTSHLKRTEHKGQIKKAFLTFNKIVKMYWHLTMIGIQS